MKKKHCLWRDAGFLAVVMVLLLVGFVVGAIADLSQLGNEWIKERYLALMAQWEGKQGS